MGNKVRSNVYLNAGKDTLHSHQEKRWYAIGKTDKERLLFTVFTVRNNLIGVISSRDTNKKERSIYYEQTEKDT